MICLSYLTSSYLVLSYFILSYSWYKNANVWCNCPILHLGTKEGNHEKQEPEPADEDKTPQDDTPDEARQGGAKELLQG